MLTTDFKDHIWAEIHLSDHDSLLIGCTYRSPTKEKDATLNSTMQVCELLSKAVERKNTYLLICGDFNDREIDWENESSDEKNEHITTFINTVQDCFLHQHVTENTRFRLGEEPSLLDLIFTNEEGLICNLEYQSGLGGSDHISLSFYLHCQNEMERKLEPKPNFYRADYTRIRRNLEEVKGTNHFQNSTKTQQIIFSNFLSNTCFPIVNLS